MAKGSTRQILYKREPAVQESPKKEPQKKIFAPVRLKKAVSEPVVAPAEGLSGEVYSFLKARPLIKIRQLANMCEVDPANFAKKMTDGKPIPVKVLEKMALVLRDYGFQAGVGNASGSK